MNTQLSTVYRYRGEHLKLGSKTERCGGSHSLILPKGSLPPPESQTAHCAICAAYVPMSLAVPKEGVDVAAGTNFSDVMAKVTSGDR